MRLNLKPLNDKVVIEPKKPDEKSLGGVILPETAKGKEMQGTIVAVGPGRMCEKTGERLPMSVKIGDQVLFTSWGGTEIEIERAKYRILTEGDVLAIIG